MNSRLLIFFTGLCLPLATTGQAQENEPVPNRAEVLEPAPVADRTFSKTKQFVVSGGDAQARGAVASIAEELKERMHKLLGIEQEEDGWKSLITVSLEGDPNQARPPFPFKRVIATGPRLYRLRAHLGQGLQLSKLEAQLVRLILLEHNLREVPDDDLIDGMKVPPWAVEGILEAIRYRSDEINRAVYKKLYEDGSILSIDELLKVEKPEKLDAATRQVYTASSGALILALTSQDGGKSALMSSIRSLILDPADPRSTLQRDFPGLNLGKKSLEKWWALQVANLAAPLTSESLTIAESDERIDRILTFRLKNKDTDEVTVFLPDQVLEASQHPASRVAFLSAQQQFSRLSFRCFPDYRPIILEYSRILNELNLGKSKKAEIRLSNLAKERRIMMQLSIRARDYLDWYQITSPEARSGRFKEFLEAMEKLRSTPKKRKDPISSYLDVIERFKEREK